MGWDNFGNYYDDYDWSWLDPNQYLDQGLTDMGNNAVSDLYSTIGGDYSWMWSDPSMEPYFDWNNESYSYDPGSIYGDSFTTIGNDPTLTLIDNLMNDNFDWGTWNTNDGSGPTYENLNNYYSDQSYDWLNDFAQGNYTPTNQDLTDLYGSMVDSSGNLNIPGLLQMAGTQTTNQDGTKESLLSKIGKLLGGDGSTGSTLGKLAQLGGSAANSALQSSAANKAADAYITGAKYAADLQYKGLQDTLALQKEQWQAAQERTQPWIDVGKENLTNLNEAMPDLTAPYGKEYALPTEADMMQDPGYQFRVSEGQKAMERSAASKGGALGGAALKEALRYGQNMGSQEYQNVADRNLQQFNTNYNVWSNDQANRYNRLANLAGLGQTSANQLNATGTNYANASGNAIQGATNQMSDYATQEANARASGYIQNGNIWGNLLNNVGDYISLAQILRG